MSNEIFDEQITLSLRRLEELWQRADNLPKPSIDLWRQAEEFPAQQQELLQESLEELTSSLEELQVITEELRQQNDELARSHKVIEAERQRYQELFELAPDGYLVTTKEGAILEANQAAVQLLNISSTVNLAGKPLVVFVAADERRDFSCVLNELSTGKPVRNWRVLMQPRHKSRFIASLTVTPVQDVQGQVVSLRWWLQDITQQQHKDATEASVPASIHSPISSDIAPLSVPSEPLFRAMFENAAIGMAILDHQGDVIKSNQALQKMLGYSAPALPTVFQELLGLDQPGRESVLFQQLIAGQHHSYHLEKCFLSQLGVLQSGRLTVSLVQESGEAPAFVMCMLTDVTELDQLEAAQQTQQGLEIGTQDKNDYLNLHVETPISEQAASVEQLVKDLPPHKQAATNKILTKEERINQLKAEYTLVTAHELRNPLNTIFAFADLLESRPFQGTQEKKVNYLRHIKANVKRVTQLLDDLLLIGKLETKTINVTPSLIDLSEFCRRLIAELQQGKEQEQMFTLAMQHQPLGIWDEKLLRCILENLLTNAVENSAKESEVKLEVSCQNQQVVFRIHASAIKIPQQDKNHLFPASAEKDFGGEVPETNLRLLIAQQCAIAQGGEMAIESMEGIGTTFTVTLPRHHRQRQSQKVDLNFEQRNSINN